MAKVLVVYGTTEGHTAKVASFVADVGRRAGHEVTVMHAASNGIDLDVAGYDAFVVGASVHEGWHQAYVRDWISAHRTLLETRPSAFFQVSLTSLVHDQERDRDAHDVVAMMTRETGWTPSRVGFFAGALKYTRYSWLKRLLVKEIARRQAGETDTSQDHEYTDWSEVERWSRAFFDTLRATPRPTATA